MFILPADEPLPPSLPHPPSPCCVGGQLDQSYAYTDESGNVQVDVTFLDSAERAAVRAALDDDNVRAQFRCGGAARRGGL